MIQSHWLVPSQKLVEYSRRQAGTESNRGYWLWSPDPLPGTLGSSVFWKSRPEAKVVSSVPKLFTRAAPLGAGGWFS